MARRAPRTRTGIALAVSDLEARSMLSVAAGLVADINQLDTSPTDLTAVNGKLFFVTDNNAASTESLWVTGGKAQGAVKLAAIDDTNGNLPSNSPPYAVLNGTVYFMSTASSGGIGLFKSDGTTAGTSEVAALAGPGENLTAAGGKIYFTENGSSGLQLWVSDGTASGTTEVSTFGPSSSMVSISALGSSVYFSIEQVGGPIGPGGPGGPGIPGIPATTTSPGGPGIPATTASPGGPDLPGIPGTTTSPGGPGLPIPVSPASPGGPVSPQLWTSNGTSGGTVQLTNFASGGSVRSLTPVGGQMAFIGDDGTHGDELWTSNGTPSGTKALTAFNNLSIDSLQNVNGAFYFDAYDSTKSAGQLWASDGTSTGTVPLTTAGGTYQGALDFTAVGSTVYFVGVAASATDGTSSMQLWAINGKTAAPVAPNISWASAPSELTALNSSTLLFTANDGSGEALWKSDGTASGTTELKEINPGLAGSFSSNYPYNAGNNSYADPVVVGGVVYYSADDGTDGQELWKSDGTPGDTVMVKDIDPGPASSSPQSLTDVDGTLYFVAHDGSGANQLWITDGTAGGTSLVQSFTPAQNQSSNPSNLSVIGGTLYFTATDGIDGGQLWNTNGTASGTTMVTDFPQISTAYGAPGLQSVVGLDGAVFFEGAITGAPPGTIYRSDGTPAGTSTIFTPDSSTDGITGLTVSGNSLYFLTTETNDAGSANDLWKSDGTSAGTALVASIPNSYGASTVTAVNGKVFFAVETPPDSNGDQNQLWVSDGTATGTVKVRSMGSPMQAAVALGNKLVFTGSDSSGSGVALWETDGTAAGTIQLHDFPASGGSGFVYGNAIGSLTVAEGNVLFVARSGANPQLWASNGTVAGTVALTTISNSFPGPSPTPMVGMGGKAFFVANDPANGQNALWSSDGTAAGTKIIKDMGDNSYTNNQLVASDKAVFFVEGFQPGSTGPELWESDGTASGTTDIGRLPQMPTNLTADGSTVYFTATDNHGTELWSARASATPTPTPTPTPKPTPKPAPPPTASQASTSTPAPTIIGEQPIFRRKINKKGKPEGKAVLTGFTLEFSRAMAPTAALVADYQLQAMGGKRAGKNKAEQVKRVGFTVSYNPSNDTVTVDLTDRQSFPKGGVLTVSTAVAGATGRSLAGNNTFAISAGGKHISPE
jgi:ELWxxDGT repeat protein